MKKFSVIILGVICILLSAFSVSAESIPGAIGSSTRWAVGWIDLDKITDFKKGDRLKITVGGTAKKILIRFLPKGADPNDPTGIDDGPRQVPDSRVLEVTLESDHTGIMQISAHGGQNPFGIYSLGEDNGLASLVNIERIDGKSDQN